MKHKYTKKITLVIIIIICILTFCHNNVYANNLGDVFYEYEQQHQEQHRNAELQGKYIDYIYNAFAISIIVLVGLFLILIKYKKNNTIKSVYILILTAVIIGAVLSRYYIRNKYYSDLAVLDTISIFNAFIIFTISKMILSCFIKTEKIKNTILIDSIPETLLFIISLISNLISGINDNYEIKYMFEDISVLLVFWIKILIYTNLVMLPIYLLRKGNKEEVEDENIRN